MARYRITDPQSGRTVTVSGKKPPTQEDAEAIFQQAGLRGGAPEQPKTLTQQAQGVSDGLRSIGLGAIPNILGSVAFAGQKIGIGKNPLDGSDMTPEQMEQLFAQNPFMSARTARETGGVADAGRDLAGAASYLTPIGGAMKVRAGLGAVSGGLGALSQENMTPESLATGVGLGAVLPPGLSVLGKGVAKATTGTLNTMQKPITGATNDGLIALAKKYGVDLPVSAKSNNRLVKMGEGLTERSNVFGQKVTDKIMKARTRLDDVTQQITDKNVREPNFRGVGEAIQQGFEEYTNAFNKQKTAMYDAVPREAMQAPATVANTLEALQEIVGRKDLSLLGNNNKTLYKNLLDAVSGDGTPSIASLKQTRTEIGAMKDNFADAVATGDKASLNRLYAALSDDLDQSISQVDQEAGTALREATDFYREGIAKINSKLGDKIANSKEPEKLVNELIKKNSESTVELVKEVIGKEGVQNLQESFLAKIYSQSTKNGVLDPQKLEKQISDYGLPTMKKLLSPEQFDNLQQALTQLKEIKQLRQGMRNPVAEGSQTGYIWTAVGGLGTAFTNPMAFAGFVLGQGALAGLYATQTGNKLLTEGINTAPIGQMIERAGNKAGNLAPKAATAVNNKKQYDRFEALRNASR